MKRPHRRMHLLLWLLLAPVTAIAGFAFWTMRPQTPFTELPPGVATVSETPETP